MSKTVPQRPGDGQQRPADRLRPRGHQQSDAADQRELEREHDVEEMGAGEEVTDAEAGNARLMAAAQDDIEADEMAESTIWQGTFSPKALVGEWIIVGLVIVGALVGLGFAGVLDNVWPVAAAVAGIAVLYEIGNAVIRRMSVMYRLTSQRFIHEHGLIFRKTDRVEAIDIDDISFNQGPIQRIMDVGTIVITSSDRSSPQLKVPGIAQVSIVANQLDAVRRKERLRRGIHLTN